MSVRALWALAVLLLALAIVSNVLWIGWLRS